MKLFLSFVCLQVKFVENHAAIPDASAAFVRFSIAAGAMLPFADWKQKEVLVAGNNVNRKFPEQYPWCVFF